jgi:hypothetical protein
MTLTITLPDHLVEQLPRKATAESRAIEEVVV